MSENTNPEMAPGRIGWNELITSDVEGAKRFYGAMFGWEAETMPVAPGWDYTLFKLGGAMVAGMIGLTPEMSLRQPQWLNYMMSNDISADVTKAKAAGATILKETMEVPKIGIMAVIKDPQGAVFALWQAMEQEP